MCNMLVVTQLNLKKFLFMKLGSLLSTRCRHRSMKSSSMEGRTSLSTALVILVWATTVVGHKPLAI